MKKTWGVVLVTFLLISLFIQPAYSIDSLPYHAHSPLWIRNIGSMVNVIAISDDGQFIAAGNGIDGDLVFFHKDGQEPRWSYTEGYIVFSVAIASSGEYVAMGGEGKVYVFDYDSPIPIMTYTIGNHSIYSVDITPDGAYIVAATRNEGFFSFSISGPLVWTVTPSILENPKFIAISDDGEYIVTATDDKIQFYSRYSTTPIWSYDLPFGEDVSDIELTADGQYTAAITRCSHYPPCEVYNSTLLLFNQAGSLWSITDEFLVMDLSSDGRYLMYGTGNGVVHLFNPPNSTVIRNYTVPFVNYISRLVISGNGQYFAVIYDQNVYSFQLNATSPSWYYNVGPNYPSLTISKNGEYIAVGGGSGNGNVYLFHQTGNSPIFIIVAIIVIAAPIVVSYFYNRKKREKKV